MTPSTLVFSPFDAPYVDPTSKKHSNAVHATIGFHVRFILRLPFLS
jgi:hypothetical protein